MLCSYKKYPDLYRKKIQPSPLWNYYLMVVAAFVFIVSIIINQQTIRLVSFLCWLALTLAFAIKRLKHTSKNRSILQR